jgi:hypothetical protein
MTPTAWRKRGFGAVGVLLGRQIPAVNRRSSLGFAWPPRSATNLAHADSGGMPRFAPPDTRRGLQHVSD